MNRKRCSRCGAFLATDHLEDALCTPCLRSKRDYDPRRDPYFLDALLVLLAERPYERVDPVRAMGLLPEHRRVVRDAVRTLRRRGFVIEGRPRCVGYKYLGFVEVLRMTPTDRGATG